MISAVYLNLAFKGGKIWQESDKTKNIERDFYIFMMRDERIVILDLNLAKTFLISEQESSNSTKSCLPKKHFLILPPIGSIEVPGNFFSLEHPVKLFLSSNLRISLNIS